MNSLQNVLIKDSFGELPCNPAQLRMKFISVQLNHKTSGIVFLSFAFSMPPQEQQGENAHQPW